MSGQIILTGIPYVISLISVVAAFYGIHHTNQVNRSLQEQRLRSEERTQVRNMLRDKGEELYMLIDVFETDFRNQMTDYAKVIEFGQEWKGNLRASLASLLKIEMLTYVYFPIAKPHLEKLKMYVERRGALVLQSHKAKTKTEKHQLAGQVLMLTTYTAEASEKLQQSVLESLGAIHDGMMEIGTTYRNAEAAPHFKDSRENNHA